MNAIDKALQDITFSIPAEIRQWTFGTTPIGGRLMPINERQSIRQHVIDNRVLVDCNLIGGEQVTVPLEKIPFQELPDGSALYNVPITKLQGRRIQSVYSVSTADQRTGAGSKSHLHGSLLTASAQRILDAHAFGDSSTTNRVRLVGENVILVEERISLTQLYLRCVLTNDAQLSNFSPRAFPAFSKLCTYAAKAHIYNEGILKLDAGMLNAGVTIGRFREVIDGYADSNELYTEFLHEKFAKISFQADRESFTNHLRTIGGGSLL